MNLPSKLLEQACQELSELPGIGKRAALKHLLHLIKQPKSQTLRLVSALQQLREGLTYCRDCKSICDHELCDICSNENRDKTTICVVEEIQDVMSLENTGVYKGVYHVLAGRISPMDGIGPHQLNIASLIERLKNNPINEVIFALSSTLEGDTTNYYIFKQLKDINIKTSTLARGVSIGDPLEYIDQATLSKSILNRIPFEDSIKSS